MNKIKKLIQKAAGTDDLLFALNTQNEAIRLLTESIDKLRKEHKVLQNAQADILRNDYKHSEGTINIYNRLDTILESFQTIHQRVVSIDDGLRGGFKNLMTHFEVKKEPAKRGAKA